MNHRNGWPFVFAGTAGVEVDATAIVFPAIVQYLGGQNAGFGVDSVSATVAPDS